MSASRQTHSDPAAPTGGGFTRRSFLDALLGFGVVGWLGSILYPVLAFLRTPAQVEAEPSSVVAAQAKDMKPNSSVVFRFGRNPAILVMGPDGRLRAFSGICTHLECTVQYRADMQHIWCACHNGHYDLNGRNISGPPPRPLAEYRVVVQGENVIVSRT